jgi:dephospho-CoA kinase
MVIGLTGSVSMGKSTVAGMFAEEGIPVFDADRAVHELYRGAAAPLVEAAFPGTVVDGVVDRTRLGARVLGDPAALRKLEEIVHPLVREAEAAFRTRNAKEGRAMIVLDIPLLLEQSNGEQGNGDRADVVVVVTTDAETQRKRVLGRPNMTDEKFARLLSLQLPDAEKRKRAHFLIDTTGSFEETRRQVRSVIAAVEATAAAR